MKGGVIPLGSVRGIEIRLHVTFLLLIVLVVLAGTQPGSPGVLGQLAWITVVFSSVVVHELAHSLLARRRGMTVKGITLLPIGGVSEIEQLPDHPRDEFLVAGVGPLTSLAMAGAFGVITVAVGADLFPPGLVGGDLTARIAWMNLLLAGFNLLPAFPLDGGRVLRAWLAQRKGLGPATQQAAAAGRALAVGLAVVGLLSNVWLALIGAFIYFGATAEAAATTVHLRLRGLRVGDVMVAGTTPLPADAWVAEVRTTLRHAAERDVPVVDGDGRYAGLVDGLVLAERGDPCRPLRDYARTEAPTLAPRDDLEHAAERLTAARVPAAAVLDRGGHVVGVLRLEDVGRLVAADDTTG
jgi:stage IV sporulation protein FB